MSKNDSVKRFEEEIEQIKQQLLELGPMHPGSVSSQYHACGNPKCRCHDPENPKKHGPYNKLTFVRRGKSACRFVREENLEEMKSRLQAYKTFKDLTDRWVAIAIKMGETEFFKKAKKAKKTK